MKIAIYHNLESGGGLTYINKVAEELSKQNSVEIYCHKKNLQNKIKENIFPLKKTNNIFQHLLQVFIELKKINKQISLIINDEKYDLVIIGQCKLIQSPYLLRYIAKNIPSLYLYNEPIREYYEETSYDYYSLRRLFARLVRFPIKLIDKNNCKKAKTIISCSEYSSYTLKKIYKKNSFIIYPGLKKIKPTFSVIKNNHKYLSIGLLAKIKGHEFSIKQLENNNPTSVITIIGNNSTETDTLKKIINKSKIKIYLQNNCNDIEKNKILDDSQIYLANQQKEPFGISTLEAVNKGLYTLGINEGGTSEIISLGINGILYKRNEMLSIKIARLVSNMNNINSYKNYIIKWKTTVNHIYYLYNYLFTSTPND